MGAAGRDSPVAELRGRLRGSIKPLEVRELLDGLSHEERVEAVRSLGRGEQRRLYAAVEDFAPLRLADLVPPRAGELETVRHYGRNTLPLFRLFEKRMCRPRGEDRDAPVRLYGFNFQPLSGVTGPGYFVAREDPAHPEVLIDYREIPSERPPGWPEVRPNDRGLSRFVYGGMVDRLRRVSEHVTIGSAFRRGREIGSWFVLCREA